MCLHLVTVWETRTKIWFKITKAGDEYKRYEFD